MVWRMVMATNMGSDSSILVRENNIAVRAAFGFASAGASTKPKAIFWFGQITSHTLRNMMMASHMPMPMNTLPSSKAKPLAAFKVSEETK